MHQGTMDAALGLQIVEVANEIPRDVQGEEMDPRRVALVVQVKTAGRSGVQRGACVALFKGAGMMPPR